MRRARDSVADRPRRRPSKDGGRAAGLRLCARCPTDDRKLAAQGDCADARMRMSRSEGGPASCGPNAEPPYRARVLRRAPLTRRVPWVSGTLRLSHTEPVRGNEPEVESHLAQSSGIKHASRRLDAGPGACDTGRRPAGSATFLRPTRGPPQCSGAGRLWSGRPAISRPPGAVTRAQPRRERKTPPERGFHEAAGLGFEPRLPGPEPGVLPLDDPATAGHCSRPRSPKPLRARDGRGG